MAKLERACIGISKFRYKNIFRGSAMAPKESPKATLRGKNSRPALAKRISEARDKKEIQHIMEKELQNFISFQPANEKRCLLWKRKS